MKQLVKLFPFLRPYAKTSLLALALLTALVFFDLAIPRLVQRIIDQGIGGKNPGIVLKTALIMLGISLLSAIFTIGNNYFSVLTGEGVAFRLREALFAKIQTFSFANLDEQKTGQLLVRMTSDAGALQRVVLITLRIGTRAPLLMIGSLSLMISTNPALALTMLPLLIITSTIIILFTVKMEPLFSIVLRQLDRLNTILQENISGIRLVKSFVRAPHEERRFEEANEAYTDRSVRSLRIISTMSPILKLCINAGIVVVVWAGGIRSVGGEMSVGEIVAFTNYLLTTMMPLIMLTVLSNVWAGGIASAKRIGEVLSTVPAVGDQPDALTLAGPVAGKLVLEDVSFCYNSGKAEPDRHKAGIEDYSAELDVHKTNAGFNKNEPALSGISLIIEAGQKVAILGATGAGKTTLVNLLPRLYDVSSGRILLDGTDVRKIRQDSLLAQFGLVPQETILFSGAIRDNIRYGNPQASDEAVEKAARIAQAHEFILNLPAGYDTHVEERGVNLSGGQKQRLAIARALLTRPAILILDDSTSSVDVETEAKIHAALESSDYRPTTIIVAQRISTVLKADKIVLLEQGRIAAEGTHTELMQGSAIYREIYQSQLGNGLEGKW
ncbi:MAG: ABC transporter ATP-binding protein [Syntrophales bacterium]